MSDSVTDFYQQKTDAELLFFVEHPAHYQPSLVESARRELRRRGVTVAVPIPPSFSEPESPGRKTGPIVLVVAAIMIIGSALLHFVQQKSSSSQVPASVAAAPPKAPPRLTEVATSVIPDYGAAVKASVQRQIQHIPAAERVAAAKAGMPLHQYRELAKRFWTAETQTEYVMEQARQGKVGAALPGHVEAAMATWQQWNKATVYGYKFAPAMASHLDLMTRVARQQQEGLADLLIVANNPQPFENEKTKKRAADVNDLLSGLLPKSPVTGQSYNPIVRRIIIDPKQ